jgi:hypothetical protein
MTHESRGYEQKSIRARKDGTYGDDSKNLEVTTAMNIIDLEYSNYPPSRINKSDIEPKQDYISLLHYIFLSFTSKKSFRFCN